MEVRFATEKDIEVIADLWERLDDYNFDDLKLYEEFRDSGEIGKERYMHLLKGMFDEKNIIVVGIIDEKILGCVNCVIEDQFGDGPIDATIKESIVHPSTRGKGLGTAMYKFLEDELRARKVVGITTEVYENNEISLNFHEKNGYKVISKSVELYKKL